jgi:hypothetical protein
VVTKVFDLSLPLSLFFCFWSLCLSAFLFSASLTTKVFGSKSNSSFVGGKFDKILSAFLGFSTFLLLLHLIGMKYSA